MKMKEKTVMMTALMFLLCTYEEILTLGRASVHVMDEAVAALHVHVLEAVQVQRIAALCPSLLPSCSLHWIHPAPVIMMSCSRSEVTPPLASGIARRRMNGAKSTSVVKMLSCIHIQHTAEVYVPPCVRRPRAGAAAPRRTATCAAPAAPHGRSRGTGTGNRSLAPSRRCLGQQGNLG